MRCPTSEQLAGYHIDGVAGAEQKHIQLHVAHCKACQQELRLLALTVKMVESIPAPVMPDNLWPGVAARIATLPHRRVVSWFWRAMAGAGLAASLLIGFLVANHQESPLPRASGTMTAYVSQHQLLSLRDPLADRASLGVLLAASQESQ